VDGKLKVVEWEEEDKGGGLLFSRSLTTAAARLLGLPEHSGGVLEAIGADRLFLDGLLSVWHPEKAVWGD
jgi:protease-4